MSGIIGGIKGSMKKKNIAATGSSGDSSWSNVTLLLTGDDLLDHSSSPKTVAVYGNTAVNTSTKKYGTGSIYFDGTGDYLTTDNGRLYTNGDFTIDCWVYRSNAVAVYDAIFTTNALVSWQSPTNTQSLVVSANGFHGLGNPWTTYSSGYSVPVGQWVYVAVVKSGTTVTFYFDGVAKHSTPHSGYVGWDGVTQGIGVFDSEGGPARLFWNGYIDDFRITTGVARYTSNFTPPTTGALTAPSRSVFDPNYSNVTLLLRGNGTNGSQTFTDESINATSITASGSAQISTTAMKYGSGSMYFNGSSYIETAKNFASPDVIGKVFTIEFWVNPTSVSGNYWLFCSSQGWGDTTYSGSFLVGIYSGYASGSIAVAGTGIGAYWFGGNTAVPVNVWSHVAVVGTDTNLTIFLNGIQIGQNAWPAGYQGISIPGWSLGGGRQSYTDGVNNLYTGYVDDLRVTKGVSRYMNNFTPPTYTHPTTTGTPVDPNFSNVSLLLTGDDLADHSSNVKTISASTTPIQTSTKKYGTGAMYFNGVRNVNKITVNDHPDVNLNGVSDWTIECWLNPDGDYSKYNVFVDKRNTAQSYTCYLRLSTGYVSFFNNQGNFESSTTLTTGVWSHVAYVYRNSTLYIYVNGTQVYSNNTVVIPADTGNLTVGETNTAFTAEQYKGYMDDLRITKGVARYTTAFTPPTYALPAVGGQVVDPNYSDISLLLTGDDLIDHSISPKTLTSYGNTVVSTSTKKYGTGSIYFDGNGDYLKTSSLPTELQFGTGDFTFESWVYHVNAASAYETYYCCGSNGFDIRRNPTGKLEVVQPAVKLVLTSIASLPSNQWIHVCAVRKNGTTSIYLNGVYDTSGADTSNYTGTSYACVSCTAQSLGTYPFAGYIDDMRVTKGVTRYTTNFTPPTYTLPTA